MYSEVEKLVDRFGLENVTMWLAQVARKKSAYCANNMSIFSDQEITVARSKAAVIEGAYKALEGIY